MQQAQNQQPRKTELYLLRALTHLHAGSGDTGYGVVDKTVQRDPLDELPVIHASGLKGAFRELLEQYFPKTITGEGKEKVIKDHPVVEHIFGTGIDNTRNPKQKEDNRQPGSYRFMEAQLLCLPVRSNVRPFFRATSPFIVKSLLSKVDDLKIELEGDTRKALDFLANLSVTKGTPKIFTKDEHVWLEELEATREGGTNFDATWNQLFGENLAAFHHDDLKSVAASLPVIARNYLENGISQNLWYEEIVPRETRFYFPLQTTPFPGTTEGPSSFREIMAQTVQPNGQVQVGGNASVGYGLCTLSCISQ